MPNPGTARSFTGTHVTTGYDANAKRMDSKKDQRVMNRKNRRGGRK